MAGHEPVAGWQDEIAGWQDALARWLREPETPGAELSPEQVIAWLRGPEGDRWMRKRAHRISRHGPDAGIFASVIPQPGTGNLMARWPGRPCTEQI